MYHYGEVPTASDLQNIASLTDPDGHLGVLVVIIKIQLDRFTKDALGADVVMHTCLRPAVVRKMYLVCEPWRSCDGESVISTNIISLYYISNIDQLSK